jgi:hypothetical protein
MLVVFITTPKAGGLFVVFGLCEVSNISLKNSEHYT